MQIVADGYDRVEFTSKNDLQDVVKQDEVKNGSECVLFGDFNNKDYDKFFSCDITVQFLCDTYNATKSWVEEGQKHLLDFEPLEDELISFNEETCEKHDYGDVEEEAGNFIDESSHLVNGIDESEDIDGEVAEDISHLDLSDKEDMVCDTNTENSEVPLEHETTNVTVNGHVAEDVSWSGNEAENEDLQENENEEEMEVDYSANETESEDALKELKNEKNEKAEKIEVDQSQKKSWASLFKTSETAPETVSNGYKSARPVKLELPVPNKEVAEKEVPDENSLAMIPMENDERASKLAEFVSHWYPDYSRTHIQLHGLINRANWCYINASLQALLAIPAIYHFFKNLHEFLNLNAKSTSTPLTDSMIAFFNKFQPVEVHTSGKKENEELNYGAAFEPKGVYEVLSVMKSSLSEKGRQEDAEEFLSFLLNGIHDELVGLGKLVQPKAKLPELTNGEVHDSNDSEEEAWEEVGPKNKVRTIRKAVIEGSLIKHVFGGVICSSVLQTGVKESTTFQPFFTLQLDIQSENIQTLSNAIEFYFMKEKLQGFTCAKTKTEVEASRRISLEELPLMFIFHLKYFVFDRKGGSQKLHKEIDIPVDLEIPRDILSNSKNAALNNVRRYKLHAIVYHHGRHAAGGHYTAAVHHGNPFGWIHFDDNQIKTINMNETKHLEGSVPYLLFYERIQHR